MDHDYAGKFMIIRNRARCCKCDDIIESTHRHDMKWCRCGAISVDGGHAYLKRSLGSGATVSDLEELSEKEHRILIFGSRGWSDPDRIHEAIVELQNEHPYLVIVQGECFDSPDVMARDIAYSLGMSVIGVRADWITHDREGRTPVPCWCPTTANRCKAAGFRRNQLMVDTCDLDEAIGYRMPGKSNGTDDMAERLERAGIPYRIEHFERTILDG